MFSLAQNEGNLDLIKNHLKNKIKKKIQKEVLNKASSTILLNPIFWIVIGILIAIVLVFFIIAAAVSTTEKIASEIMITEKIVSPQIYHPDLEDIISSDFGPRLHPVTGKVNSFHTGLDIAIPAGTPVQSSTDGVVTTVSYPTSSDAASTQNAGIYIVVKASDPEIGMSNRYLHLSNSFVTPGQSVRKGEIIGLSGNTGRSTGAHLHYEFIPEGEEAIDPKPFVLLMSKLIDTASNESFKTMRKIKWSEPEKESPELPYYDSGKMLYVSGVYMESAAPSFNTTGTIFKSQLVNGGTSLLETSQGDGSILNPSEDGDVVTGPLPDLGTLHNPFFLEYAASAQTEERRSGIPASITLAQMAEESGWGKNKICNNMFGIKADLRWKGPTCKSKTGEHVGGGDISIVARFRAYDSVADSIKDHTNFLLINPRYQLTLSKDNPYEFANELQRAGYASNPSYAYNLKRLIRNDNLTSLDMNRGFNQMTGQPYQDVPFFGGGSSGGGDSGGGNGTGGTGTGDTITILYGIRQYYGNPAYKLSQYTDLFGNTRTGYKELKDPLSGNIVFNLENYNRVINYSSGTDIFSPKVYLKDVPDAIQVTIQSKSEDELYVSDVQYIKGKY